MKNKTLLQLLAFIGLLTAVTQVKTNNEILKASAPSMTIAAGLGLSKYFNASSSFIKSFAINGVATILPGIVQYFLPNIPKNALESINTAHRTFFSISTAHDTLKIYKSVTEKGDIINAIEIGKNTIRKLIGFMAAQGCKEVGIACFDIAKTYLASQTA